MKIFIINLLRSTHRKESMKEQISKLFSENPSLKDRLEFIFFEAVDGDGGEEFAKFHPAWAKYLFGRELSPGEKGCFASHYKLWQKCLELNEGIFIIEDDVEFTQAFNANNLEKILKSPYEYVRIYHIKEAKLYDLELNFKITFSNVAGTQGYYLKPSAARKFIKKCQFLIKPVDDSMDYSEVLNIVFTPLFLKELPLQSDIATRERERERENNYKLTRELYRIYCNIRRFFFMLKIKRRLKL
ncbi:glycosyltransferase family 25 protein [Campylobacter upsaliensis]|uniref:glycosyltransferase family 25 protein n=1 Tax=Campylobacter upsaliensis TaxID=28080 RepID=UPI002874B1A7|nr:glycosyltransferase family 25 protein [Campylobacter upsaliensis]EGK8071293.1 glycosyltransferase family 25 protein [Campylobacter upsaliensis]EGR9248938.1 glycosyltransferase family 25 protein [Campylobacter upsaliensis]ELF1060707.1 glycosyltransferase family 25 protein [Campylobacter upsaliensis]MEB2789684.1 glycosyltransferase family 25 protein [Campylobacter upsaliensis]